MITSALNIYKAFQNREPTNKSDLVRDLRYEDILGMTLSYDFEFASPERGDRRSYNPLIQFLLENNHTNFVEFFDQIDRYKFNFTYKNRLKLTEIKITMVN